MVSRSFCLPFIFVLSQGAFTLICPLLTFSLWLLHANFLGILVHFLDLVVDLGTNHTAVQLALGVHHTRAMLDNNLVKCWGENINGRLGIGDTRDRGVKPGEMGDHLPTVRLGTNRTVQYIQGGDFHMCAILDDWSFKCWGENQYSQLGQGDAANRGDTPDSMGDNLPAIDIMSVGKYQYSNCLLNRQLLYCLLQAYTDIGPSFFNC